MIKVEEHKQKIKEIKTKVNQSQGIQRKQYLKCLHRLQKELLQCKLYLQETQAR
jgi:hypothetical protein